MFHFLLYYENVQKSDHYNLLKKKFASLMFFMTMKTVVTLDHSIPPHTHTVYVCILIRWFVSCKTHFTIHNDDNDVCIHPTFPPRGRCDTKSFSVRSKTGLNSDSPKLITNLLAKLFETVPGALTTIGITVTHILELFSILL